MTEDNEKLRHAIERLEKVEQRHLITHRWWYALWHGLLVGIGGTVGVAIVLTVVLWVLNQLSGVPGTDTARSLIESATQR